MRKILIVYEKMGMGHLRNARIVQNMLKGEEGIEVVCLAGSDMLGSSSVESIVRLWNSLIRRNWISVCDFVLNWFTRIFILPLLEVGQARPFFAKLGEINPDMIISTADGFNKGFGIYAGKKGIPFWVFLTETSVFADLVYPAATHFCYFRETVEGVQDFDLSLTNFAYTLDESSTFPRKVAYVLRCYWDYVFHLRWKSLYRCAGAVNGRNNGAACVTIGPLAEAKHFAETDVEAVKKKLGIDNGRDTVVLASGSIGGRFLMDALDTIRAGTTRPMNILVMCGGDEEMYRAIRQRSGGDAKVSVLPFGFVDNFQEFLAVADCLVARPSASTFNEAIVSRTPMIALDQVTSNDRGAVALTQAHGLGEILRSKEELPSALEKILNDKEKYARNFDRFLAEYPASYEEMTQIVVRELHQALENAQARRSSAA